MKSILDIWKNQDSFHPFSRFGKCIATHVRGRCVESNNLVLTSEESFEQCLLYQWFTYPIVGGNNFRLASKSTPAYYNKGVEYGCSAP